jgi:hypothetical protein
MSINPLQHSHGWWQKLGRIAVLASGPLAACVSPGGPLLAEPSSFRSVKDVRPRIPDELDRPVRRETSSHRGWEIREDQFTIAANTSQDDARWAAAEVAKVRSQTADLADRFTSIHRAADFGLNSLQIVIDGNPPSRRDAPPVTINVVGIQTQALLNVSPGQPQLKDQLLRLREAAAFAVLHAAEIDGTLPPWVIGGLAAHVARQGQPADAPQPNDIAPRGEPIGGQQWRWQRATQDRLESHPLDRTAAASQVGFLLAGDDGEHAPEFLAALGDSIQAGRAAAAERSSTRRRGESQNSAPEGRLKNMLAAHRQQYESWLKDPKTGQPDYQPDPAVTTELDQAQREMLVVLKLQHRMSSQRATHSPVKVATFDREKGRQAVGQPAPQQPVSLAEIAARLGDPSQPAVATLDTDGSLLLSTDRERIGQLLGWDGQRYQLERRDDRWVLATRLANGRVLRGYLADNPDKPSRPLAKFTVEDAANIGPKAKPAAQPARPAVSLQ